MATLEFERTTVTSAEPVDAHTGPRRAFAIGSEEFLASISGVTDTPFQPGNRIDILTSHRRATRLDLPLAGVERRRATD